ncbi:MAG: glycosylase, partial [Solobacterium sp.]|nr:glycosylase [Solobacterium sp.]
MPKWLKDAIFYEIYPSSFYDANGDGIGDIEGIIEKLAYIQELGCNAIWLNPCFASPFQDGGYDICDYYQVDKRFGTNEDLIHLFQEAHKRGMHILLDLVPGHTSDKHPWFIASQKAEENAYSKRYIWTNGAFEGIRDRPYISGLSERDGAYMLNFFAFQPALNYGWANPSETWMSSVDSKEVKETIAELKKIICYWLDLGCDGYRVDMADSLVKNDDEKRYTAAIWKDIRKMLDEKYPEAALVSEWSNPKQAINLAGFHMDFYLNHWGNGYNTLLRDGEANEEDHSYFLAKGKGDIKRFLDDYIEKYDATKKNGYISMLSCNHDTYRPAKTLTQREMKVFFGMLLSMPGVPFIYYGDEIGMPYLPLKNKEGGYHRTGSRTPMQWNKEKNCGFSTNDEIYLPVDTSSDAVNVFSQQEDEDSLWHTVKKWIAIRKKYEALQADEDLHVIQGEGALFIYQRG